MQGQWGSVLVALIVAVGTVLGQWFLKRQDFRRQDEVAARVAVVAEKVELVTAETHIKLDEVHQMVNQQRTDMRRYTEVLQHALASAGIAIPPDESLQK
jgi:membrane protein required for beta-lactamase induction